MRNLKRTLSLLMAAAMLIGMMVVGASAVSYDDLTDKDEIVNQEAVATMTSLNIINGKDNGSFDPKANVTRAEMAKMITVALHGGTDPVLGVKDQASFTDTKGHWAEQYIEYCTANGIISGRGDGTFDPNANVTGTEAAKMLLVALGYRSDIFQFTGAKWDINVNTWANDSRATLYDGLGYLNANAVITRDEAAQMLYNGTVVAQMLLMTPQTSITTGDVVYDYGYAGTMLNERFNADIYVGVILANEYATLGGAIQKAGEYRFQAFLRNGEAIRDGNGNIVPTITYTVAGDTTVGMLGKSYSVIIKNTQRAGVYTQVYGEPVLSDMNNIVTFTSDRRTDTAVGGDGTSANAFESELTASGLRFTSTAAVDGDGNPISVSNAAVYEDLRSAGAPSVTSPLTLQNQTRDGKVITVIDNDNDGAIDYILISTPFIGKVTSYNANGDGYITVSNKGAEAPASGFDITGEKFAKVVGVEDVAKDDIVSYVKLPDGKFYITKLESVTGNVTAQTGTNQIKLDGVVYKTSALADKLNNDDVKRVGADQGLVKATTLGKEATLYLLAGYVVYSTADESDTSYLFVTALEGVGSITGVNAKAVLIDGTNVVIKVTAVKNGSDTYKPGDATKNLLDGTQANGVATASGLAVNTIYKYSVSGSDYTLTCVTNQNITGSVIPGQVQVGGVASYNGNSRTVFLVKTGNSWTVYTGIANVPKISSTNTGYAGKMAKNTQNDVDIAVIYGGGPSATKSIYVLSDKLTAVRDGDNTIYTVAAVVDGEYNEALSISDVTDVKMAITPGLYTGDNVVLTGDKLSALLLDGNDAEKKDYSDPAAVTGLSNGNITGEIAGLGDVTGTKAHATGTLSVTSDTKFIIIVNGDTTRVLEGTIDDVIFEQGNPNGNNSLIVMTRAGGDNTTAAYYQAGVVYIIRK